MFKQHVETDRLTLIRQWSMAGAPGDVDGRFGSAPDIHALVAERQEEPSADISPPAPSPVLMKPAGEDDWRPLLLAVGE